MYNQVMRVISDSGIWEGSQRKTHRFIPSPSVYTVASDKLRRLEKIGYALQDCLTGFGRIAAIAANPRLGKGEAWGRIARTISMGVPSIYRSIMVKSPGSGPAICKVDFMEDSDGNYWIAEIDGHNKHGLGYSALAAKIRKAIAPEAKSFIGVAATIAEQVKKRGYNRIAVIYADQERFYLPELRILQGELDKHGIELAVIAESELKVEAEKALHSPKGDGDYKLFVDFPFLYHNQQLNTLLAELYQRDEISFLIPPKPFLGSKAILALIRNDAGDPELNAILASQIRSHSLDVMRQYIPETYLVHKRLSPEYWRGRIRGRRFVLKESISSGMKGTVFSDDPRFNETMSKACGSYYRFILQEEVANRSQTFQQFNSNGDLIEGQWYARITAHFCYRRIGDIIITARRDKKVHGAPDCLQLGTIIAE